MCALFYITDCCVKVMLMYRIAVIYGIECVCVRGLVEVVFRMHMVGIIVELCLARLNICAIA